MGKGRMRLHLTGVSPKETGPLVNAQANDGTCSAGSQAGVCEDSVDLHLKVGLHVCSPFDQFLTFVAITRWLLLCEESREREGEEGREERSNQVKQVSYRVTRYFSNQNPRRTRRRP